MLKIKTIIFNILTSYVNLFILFIFSRPYAVCHLQVMKITAGENDMYTLHSMNRWRHNNDIIIKKFLHMLKMKFYTKHILDFSYLENSQNDAVL